MVAGGVLAGGAALAVASRRRRADAPDATPGEWLLPAGERSTLTTDDGAELAVYVAGEGPTVVLPHCWMGGPAVWAPVAHRLVRAGRRVVLYDQRGHGSSTVGEHGFTIERLGGDLRAVLEHVDARDAVLAGHSMGGMTVQALATHDADVFVERVQRVVLVSTAAGGLSRGRLDARIERVVGDPRLARLLAGAVGLRVVRGSVGRQAVRDHLELTRDLLVACEPATRSGWLRAMAGMDLRKGIAAIAVPTTVLVGTRDTLTPPARAREIVAAVPGAELRVLKGYGHMLPLEAPDEVAAAIEGRSEGDASRVA